MVFNFSLSDIIRMSLELLGNLCLNVIVSDKINGHVKVLQIGSSSNKGQGVLNTDGSLARWPHEFYWSRPCFKLGCTWLGYLSQTQMFNNPTSDAQTQCYKTLYGRDLLLFLINQSVCLRQVFPAWSNICGQGQVLTEMEHLSVSPLLRKLQALLANIRLGWKGSGL